MAHCLLQNKRMDQCCWYRESTCCDATVGNRFVLPKVREELRTVAGIVSPRMLFRFLSSHRRSCVFAGGDCFLAIADFLCLACSPTIGNYVQVRIKRSFLLHHAYAPPFRRWMTSSTRYSCAARSATSCGPPAAARRISRSSSPPPRSPPPTPTICKCLL